MPWIWKNKEEAEQVLSFYTMLAGRTGAVNLHRRAWDGALGQELLDSYDGFSVVSVDFAERLEMDMGVDPEGLPTATEVFEALMWGTPQEFDVAYALLSESSQSQWQRPEIKNVKDNGGQEVVAA